MQSDSVSDPRMTGAWRHGYEILLDGLPDAILVQGSGGQIINANRAAERLVGRTRAELSRMSVDELLSDSSRAALNRWLKSPGKTLAPFAVNVDVKTAEGTLVGVDLHASMQREPNGEMAVLYALRDITERRRFEEALRTSESRFRLMANHLTEMVMAYDMDRRLTFANPAAEALTGYSVAELKELNFILWVHPADQERMFAYWERLFAGESYDDEEYRMLTKDGRTKWVEASWCPIRDEEGRQVGVLGRERDVTKRRSAEETLRDSEYRLRISEDRYRTLFENAPFPMWEEDFSAVKAHLDQLPFSKDDGLDAYLRQNRTALLDSLRRIRIVDVNRAAREFYGASNQKELTGDLATIFEEAAFDVFRAELVALSSSSAPFRAEIPARTLKGEQHMVSMVVSRVASTPDDWSRVIVSFFDITDRKRLEERLAQSQKLESLGRLAGGIAHDFNNLLTVINGHSELLAQGLDSATPLGRGLAEIHHAGQRGAELTQQLLAFSRKQMLQPRPLSIDKLIEESRGMIERIIGEDIEMRTSLKAGQGLINADAGQMHQVLLNLVVNAREAMPKGGVLTVETRDVDLHPGYPYDSGDRNLARPHVLLRISDNGVGMDETTKGHLFEPFFTTKGISKGTGLGLSTVFGIVMQCGGQINVESQPKQGSVFSIYLPRIIEPANLEPPAEHRKPSRGSGVVLVVEDQEEVRRLACLILKNFGYEVLEAGDGESAMRLARSFDGQIQLLLTDVIMPGMNGRELATRLTQIRPTLKVIFMSGYTDQVMGDEQVLDSAVAFLQKPFSPVALAEIVKRELAN